VATYLELKDQLATALGADSAEDMSPSDQKRLGIFINTAYRECYAPIDGSRPRWATEKRSITFASGVSEMPIGSDAIDLESIPELDGIGPLSPFNKPQDEILIRSSWSHDFRPLRGGSIWRSPTINSDEPEEGQPLWYWVDTASESGDATVNPKLNLYPIPDKEFTVKIVVNVIPSDLVNDSDTVKLPGDVAWDILFPIAQGKLLTDPRYNGNNREDVRNAVREARVRLKSFRSAQKQKTSRVRLRGGW